jgi:hypothetical protein
MPLRDRTDSEAEGTKDHDEGAVSEHGVGALKEASEGILVRGDLR